MSDCNFSFTLSQPASIMVNKAKTAIENAGGSFAGNDDSGTFTLSTMAGKIEGNYSINNTNFAINITSKPMFVPCSLIENELKKFL